MADIVEEVRGLPGPLAFHVRGHITLAEAKALHQEFGWMPGDMIVRLISDQETEDDRAFIRLYDELGAAQMTAVQRDYGWIPWTLVARLAHGTETEHDKQAIVLAQRPRQVPSYVAAEQQQAIEAEINGIIDRGEKRLFRSAYGIIERHDKRLEEIVNGIVKRSEEAFAEQSARSSRRLDEAK
jgi:hypothetical protein